MSGVSWASHKCCVCDFLAGSIARKSRANVNDTLTQIGEEIWIKKIYVWLFFFQIGSCLVSWRSKTNHSLHFPQQRPSMWLEHKCWTKSSVDETTHFRIVYEFRGVYEDNQSAIVMAKFLNSMDVQSTSKLNIISFENFVSN